MKVKIFLNLILIIFLCISCSKKIEKKSLFRGTEVDLSKKFKVTIFSYDNCN